MSKSLKARLLRYATPGSPMPLRSGLYNGTVAIFAALDNEDVQLAVLTAVQTIEEHMPGPPGAAVGAIQEPKP
jgi:hypothetical protein